MDRSAVAVRGDPRRTGRRRRTRTRVVDHGTRRRRRGGARSVVGHARRACERSMDRARDGADRTRDHQRGGGHEHGDLGARGGDRPVRHRQVARREDRRGLGSPTAVPRVGEHGFGIRHGAAHPRGRASPDHAVDRRRGRAPPAGPCCPRQRGRRARQPPRSGALCVGDRGRLRSRRRSEPRGLGLPRLPRLVRPALRGRGGARDRALDRRRRPRPVQRRHRVRAPRRRAVRPGEHRDPGRVPRAGDRDSRLASLASSRRAHGSAPGRR